MNRASSMANCHQSRKTTEALLQTLHGHRRLKNLTRILWWFCTMHSELYTSPEMAVKKDRKSCKAPPQSMPFPWQPIQCLYINRSPHHNQHRNLERPTCPSYHVSWILMHKTWTIHGRDLVFNKSSCAKAFFVPMEQLVFFFKLRSVSSLL